MKIDLSGKRALVGGASQGIGAAIAQSFAEAGATVTLLARSEENLQKVLNSLPGEGHTLIAQDLSDLKAVSALVEQQMSNSGGYDILVCNTGGPKAGPIAEAAEEEFLAGFRNHVLANSMLAQLVLPHMKEQRNGRILNVISTSVKVPIPNLGVSNTIRGAVAAWAKTLSNEVAQFGVTVNNVLPGYTETVRLEALMKAYQDKTGKGWNDVVDEWKNRVPMKRFAKAEEVAALATFLASEQAGYISGTNIPVDGGRTGCL